MATATISPDRQITLPTEICDGLGIAPGDQVSFEPYAQGLYLVSAAKIEYPLSNHSVANNPMSRHQRLLNLKAEIQATPANLMESYQQETAQWEAAELADAAKSN